MKNALLAMFAMATVYLALNQTPLLAEESHARKWEYSSFHGSPVGAAAKELQTRGDEGWEICGVIPSSDDNLHHTIILLKRPKR